MSEEQVTEGQSTEEQGEDTATNMSQMILGGQQDKIIAEANQVCLAMDRTLYGSSLLPPGHSQRKAMASHLHAIMKDFINNYGDLELTVDSREFLYKNESVLKIKPNRDNYIYRMYRDGLLVLTFSSELDEEALFGFIDILNIDFDKKENLEDDIVSILWSADLSGISFRSSDTFMEGDGEDKEDEEDKSEMTVEEIRKKLLSVKPEEQDAQTKKAAVKTYDNMQIRMDALKYEKDISIEDTPESGTERIEMTGEDEKKLKESMEFRIDEGASKFAAVLSATDRVFPEQFKDFSAKTMRGYIIFCLNSCYEKHLLDFMNTYAEASGGKHPRYLIDAFAEDSVVELLLIRLDADKNNETLFSLFDIVAPAAFASIWNSLDKLKDIELRQMIPRRITKYIKEHKHVLHEYMKDCEESNALLTLAALIDADKESLSPSDFINALEHPSETVRIQTLKYLHPWITDESLEESLNPLISDIDRDIRMLLLQYLIEAECSIYQKAILKRLDTEKINDCDVEEQSLIIDALSTICGSPGLQRVRSIAFESNAGRFKADIGIRIYTMKKLAKLGDVPSMEPLRKLSKSWFIDRQIKDAARTAFKMIEARK